jgi:tetratricopeptide (TPR) repeat protein
MTRSFQVPSVKILLVHVCLVLAAFQLAACGSRQERADKYYESGMKYLGEKNYAKARVELKNALQLKGDMVQAWRGLAQIEEHDKHWPQLAQSLKRVVELDPKDGQARLRVAKLYLLGGGVAESLKMVNAAAELLPDNADVLALKAAVLFRLNDLDGATQEAERALKIQPGNADASVVLAAERFRKNNPEGALQALEVVKGAKANDLGIVLLKINIYNRMEKFDEVERLLRDLVAKYPDQATFRSQLIRFYVAHKRPNDAEKELRAIVTANPKDLAAEFQLVNLLGELKGPDAARAELVERIKAGGSIVQYQIALAKFDYGRGQHEEAIKQLEDFIAASKEADDVQAAKLALAELYIAGKNIVAAEPLIASVLKTDSRNGNALRLRASIQYSLGKYDEAIENLRQALNDQPNSAQLLQSLAVVYERSGSIELASSAYLDATKASGYNPTYGFQYIAFLDRRGLHAQAENALNELASHNPNNVSVLSTLAKVKLSQQDWVGAHAIAEQIRKLGDKRDALVADQIQGAAFGGEKRYSDSLAAFQNVYQANPNATQPMIAMVATYVRAKQPEKAEALLQDALKANPKNAEALVLLGSLRLVENKLEQGLAFYKKAIEAQPKNPAGYIALKDYYISRGQMSEAINAAEAGLKQEPKNFTLGLSLATLLEITKQYEPAIAQYETMLKDQPNSLVIANNLASMLSDHRTDKASLDRASALVTILKNSDVPQFKDTLGWVAYRRGDYGTAAKMLSEAASKLPQAPLVSYHLGMVYLANDERKKAVEQFRRAQQLAPNDAELKKMIDAALNSQKDNKRGEQPQLNGANPG